MSDPWVTIIGLGEDGTAGLSKASRTAIAQADIIFGGPRHLELVQALGRGAPWPVPFSITQVMAHEGHRVVVLASGDPFWFGVGAMLAQSLPKGAWVAHPAPSTFGHVAAALGWPLEKTLCLGLHAAPLARLRPVLQHHQQLICLLRDRESPQELAQYLTGLGFGDTRLWVAECVGGPRQRIREATAATFDFRDVQAPVAVAILPIGNAALPLASGLPDDLFHSDGQISKRPIRALTLSALAPRAGQHLWDIGAGSGAISVEWCLAAPGATTSSIEVHPDRAAIVRTNADRFGLGHRISVITAKAPDGLADLPRPDAVFLGGGANVPVLDAIWAAIPAGTRLVANAVTLESEALLITQHARHGGELMRVAISHAAPLGRMRGWKPARPITQWSVTR